MAYEAQTLLIIDALDKLGYSGETAGMLTLFQNFAKLNELIGSNGAETLFSRLTALEDKVDTMRPGSKMYGNASFSAAYLSGTQRSVNGSAYKITLDNRTQIAIPTSASGGRDIWVDNNTHNKACQTLGYLGTRVINSVDLFLSKFGSPTGNITVQIEECDPATGLPTGTVCGNSCMRDASTLNGNFYNFPVNASISKEKMYAITCTAAAGTNGQNYSLWYINTGGSVYTGSGPGAGVGSGYYNSYNTSVWTHIGYDLVFQVNMTACVNGMVCIPITDTALYGFLQFFEVSSVHDGTIVFSLRASDNFTILKNNLADKMDLTDVSTPWANSTFYLRADLALSSGTSPEVDWWGISYMGATV